MYFSHTCGREGYVCKVCDFCILNLDQPIPEEEIHVIVMIITQ